VPARRGVGQEHAELAVAHLAQRPTILPGHPHRFGPLLGETALVDHKHPVRRVQSGSDVRLQTVDHRLRRPGRLGEQALQAARRRPLDRFGHILGVAPVGLLHQQPAHVLFAPLLGLHPSEQRGEFRVKGGKGGRHPLKISLFHHDTPHNKKYIVNPSL